VRTPTQRRILRLLPALSAALIVLSVGPLEAQEQAEEYRATIKIRTKGNKRPLARARVRVDGEGVSAVAPPDSGSVADLTGLNITTDPTGKIIITLRPGRYTFTVRHKTRRPVIKTCTVPAPNDEGQVHFESSVTMEANKDALER